jgi:dTDP-4-amino-4,6-dideoxygalactose transaminase
MTTQVPFLDLSAQYQSIKSEVNAAVSGVLESGRYILGPEVEAFECEFAAYQQAAEGVALNSGTSALHLALLAAGVGPGDEVITVSMTFFATVAAIRYTGATPVFADIDPLTCTIDVSQIASLISPRTKALLPVHLYGQAADMNPILDIARRHGLAVVEDAAQAHGAEYQGRRVGSFGDAAAFSFYPGKNLGAYGEGGIALTSNPEIAARMRMLRDWGQKTKYYHDEHSFNYRMDALQGAILRVKLRHLDQWTDARRAHAAAYAGLLEPAGVRVNAEAAGRRHVYHIYGVFNLDRDGLQRHLAQAGIQTGIHYPVPVHLQRAYRGAIPLPHSLPRTEHAAREQLSLPMFPELTAAQVRLVGHTVAEWSAAHADRPSPSSTESPRLPT